MPVDIRPADGARAPRHARRARSSSRLRGARLRLERANWGHDDFADSAAELLAGTATTGHRGSRRDRRLGRRHDGRPVPARLGARRRRGDRRTHPRRAPVAAAARRRVAACSPRPRTPLATSAARPSSRTPTIRRADARLRRGRRRDGARLLRAPDGRRRAAGSATGGRLRRARTATPRPVGAREQPDVAGEPTSSAARSRRARSRGRGRRLPPRALDRPHPDALVDALRGGQGAHGRSTVPAGGITSTSEHWDAARVREQRATSSTAGRTLLVAAAVRRRRRASRATPSSSCRRIEAVRLPVATRSSSARTAATGSACC